MGNTLKVMAILASVTIGMPYALSLEMTRNVNVNAGERIRIWFGANYGQRCGTAGPPLFKLVSTPTLGEVTTEEATYVVPAGRHCEGKTYTGLGIWYKAGLTRGTDTFSYTIEFPHEAFNPRPSKGPQPVTATIIIK